MRVGVTVRVRVRARAPSCSAAARHLDAQRLAHPASGRARRRDLLLHLQAGPARLEARRLTGLARLSEPTWFGLGPGLGLGFGFGLGLGQGLPLPSRLESRASFPAHRPCARTLEAAARAGTPPCLARLGRALAACRTSDKRGARGARGGAALCGRPMTGCCANLKALSSHFSAILRMRSSSAAPLGVAAAVGLLGEAGIAPPRPNRSIERTRPLFSRGRNQRRSALPTRTHWLPGGGVKYAKVTPSADPLCLRYYPLVVEIDVHVSRAARVVFCVL